MQALEGGSSAPVIAAVVRPRSRHPPSELLKIDVDRLGVVALRAPARLLELLPIRPPPDAPEPSTILFRCSHLVSRDGPVTPTFPSRDPTDRRLRNADRLAAGEELVRALWRHLGVNRRLVSLEARAAYARARAALPASLSAPLVLILILPSLPPRYSPLRSGYSTGSTSRLRCTRAGARCAG